MAAQPVTHAVANYYCAHDPIPGSQACPTQYSFNGDGVHPLLCVVCGTVLGNRYRPYARLVRYLRGLLKAAANETASHRGASLPHRVTPEELAANTLGVWKMCCRTALSASIAPNLSAQPHAFPPVRHTRFKAQQRAEAIERPETH